MCSSCPGALGTTAARCWQYIANFSCCARFLPAAAAEGFPCCHESDVVIQIDRLVLIDDQTRIPLDGIGIGNADGLAFQSGPPNGPLHELSSIPRLTTTLTMTRTIVSRNTLLASNYQARLSHGLECTHCRHQRGTQCCTGL